MSLGIRKSLVIVLEADLLVLATNSLALVGLAALYGVDVVSLIRTYLATAFFLESGIVFVVAGAIVMSSGIFGGKVREHVFHSGDKWSQDKLKQSERRANVIIVLAILLFIEAIALALIVGQV